MTINKRQEKILNTVIREYIRSARPVSSKFLEKKYRFGVCPATIRIEMQKLTDIGLIFQPHTSAGRVPTDKGYRFFVDKLFDEEVFINGFDYQIEDWLEKKISNSIKSLQLITKNLSFISSDLILGYLINEKVLWKEGWEKVIKEPEFTEKKNINNFLKIVSFIEKEIEDLESKVGTDLPIKVYIGKENFFPRAKDFSIIVSKCHFYDREEGIFIMLGPKRMDYNKNISSLNSLIKLLEKV